MGLRADTTWNQRMCWSEGHGYWVETVKMRGVSTRVSVTLIRLGGTYVPRIRPMAAPINDPRTIITTTAAPVDACQGMEPRIQIPTGNITAAATQARMAAKTTFSTATAPVGSGASRRSSISLL